MISNDAIRSALTGKNLRHQQVRAIRKLLEAEEGAGPIHHVEVDNARVIVRWMNYNGVQVGFDANDWPVAMKSDRPLIDRTGE